MDEWKCEEDDPINHDGCVEYRFDVFSPITSPITSTRSFNRADTLSVYVKKVPAEENGEVEKVCVFAKAHCAMLVQEQTFEGNGYARKDLSEIAQEAAERLTRLLMKKEQE